MDMKALAKEFMDDPDGLEDKIDGYLQRAWNARGEADVQAIDERFASLTGWGTSEPYRNHMRAAIKELDK